MITLDTLNRWLTVPGESRTAIVSPLITATREAEHVKFASRCFLDRVFIVAGSFRARRRVCPSKSITCKRSEAREFLDRVLIDRHRPFSGTVNMGILSTGMQGRIPRSAPTLTTRYPAWRRTTC